jgi:ABC-type sugar transport system substrate-binding protein
MKRIIAIVCMLSFILTVPSFAGDKKIVLGKIPYTLEHSYHQSIVKMFEDHAKKMHGATTIIVDGQANSESALSAVENLIAQKVDGIALHSPDIGMTATAVEAAHKAGIPIVTTLIYPKVKKAPHIQPKEEFSSFRMGEVAATQWLAAHPGKTPKVAILDFGGFEQIVVLRTDPFFKGVKSVAPNATLVAKQNGQGSTVKSMEVMLDILQANPDVNIIFGANDDMALGALAACEQLGRGRMDNGKALTEIIAGVDGGENAMVKVFNPNCSFKLTHGQVRDNARAEVDTLMSMVNKSMAMDKWMEIQTLSPEFDYWNSSIESAQKFLEENFSFKKDLKALVAKQK